MSMLMSLGLFVFSLQTAPFETLRRSASQRWESKNRVKAGPAYQWTGPGEETITVEGSLVPGITGNTDQLDTLRRMAAEGKPWLLTAGTGEVMGPWIVTGLEEGRSHMLTNGTPRKVTFSLSLKKYWDPDGSAELGDLKTSLPA